MPQKLPFFTAHDSFCITHFLCAIWNSAVLRHDYLYLSQMTSKHLCTRIIIYVYIPCILPTEVYRYLLFYLRLCITELYFYRKMLFAIVLLDDVACRGESQKEISDVSRSKYYYFKMPPALSIVTSAFYGIFQTS